MRLLLIQPPDDREGMTELYPSGYSKEARSVLPPLGLLSLASYLKQRHSVYVIDMMLYPQTVLSNVLIALRPDIVGVTAVIGLWSSALNVIREVRRHSPLTSIVVGGPNATYYPMETISHKEIDYVIVGNGQKPLMTLCDALEKGDDGREIENCYVQGVRYDRFDCVYSDDYNIGAFPYPDRRFTSYMEYSVPFCPENPSTTMITSMGCPFRCAFCTQHRPPMQLCSVKSILDEMEEIQALGIRSVLIQDELFTLYGRRVRAICEGIRDRRIRLHWTVKSCIRTLKSWMPRLMKEAGCFNIHFGFESGNDDTLWRMGKGHTRAQIIETVRMVKGAGLSCTGNFMLAYPGESEEDVLQTIAFAGELGLDVSQFSLTMDSPGSQLFEEAVKVGRRSGDYFSEFTEHPDSGNSGLPLELFSASDRFSQSELRSFLDIAYASTRTLFDVR